MSEETTKIFVGGSELYVQMSFEQAQRFVEARGPGFINTVGGGRAWINRNAVAAVVAEPAKINAEVEVEQPTRLANSPSTGLRCGSPSHRHERGRAHLTPPDPGRTAALIGQPGRMPHLVHQPFDERGSLPGATVSCAQPHQGFARRHR